MRSRFVYAVIAAAVAASPAIAADPEDATINSVYSSLAKARTANDVAGMANAFGPGGLLIDARPGPAILGSELAGRLAPMAERVQKDGVKIDTAYRLERRSVLGDVALDAGYMRQTMVRPDGQTGSRYARFLVTMRRGPDGAWKIIGDASMPSEQAVFDALKPVDGLHFDG